MKKTIIILAMGCLSLTAIANEEKQSIEACKQYNKAVKSSFPNDVIIGCDGVERGAAEWSCMHDKQILEKMELFGQCCPLL